MNHTNDVYDELKGVAPILSTLSKENHLEVPNQYFEEVEEKILSQMRIYSPEHAVLPDGYMDVVETKVLQKLENSTNIHQEKQESAKIFALKWWKSVAAAVILITTGSIVMNQLSVTNDKTLAAEMIDQDIYIKYLELHPEDFDINMMIDQGLIEESDVSIVNYDEQILELLESQIPD
ncbi:MAG: hypothetical protein WBO36_13580 [Saprospiraceae bacterium]